MQTVEQLTYYAQTFKDHNNTDKMNIAVHLPSFPIITPYRCIVWNKYERYYWT